MSPRTFKKKKPATFPRFTTTVKKYCHFCHEKIDYVDYKNTKLLGKYLSRYMKIEPRRRSGSCAKHQRMVASALKRSRHMALLPFTIR
ncbi:TPA: 30S ribosomal protein S18 [Patescibacteria group bacterium]|uniref:Small ribosomal subunit protein bS18 n=2 Tax=Bacteria division Kazan-3B-28 TaxID=1798534 RepID=A0A0G1KU18_UNCK3|nr:MAG: 30S ribosomal protein S18 [candidate division Kazan bacterium GW2011_GWA1_44_22]KKT87083.1 MAG: 30S ribosomal protein S18 [candidate division Kazan bacterium GW2011_GWB1_45_10]HAR54744.1 30S ribosomal protein S18 [Patescibacteria group bacterium]HCR41829.1 30S ribosomal protein S18 [Patescibacteria group bacterium]